MPFLTLLRHAKAAQATPEQSDFDRPLTERGRTDAARMGRLIGDLDLDLALVSAAARTVETWTIASASLAVPPTTAIEPSLYLCHAAYLIDRLRKVPPETQSVIVVGHNPYIQEVALWLAGKTKADDAGLMRQKFPTGALAGFKVEAKGWAELAPKTVTFERFVTPRTLD